MAIRIRMAVQPHRQHLVVIFGEVVAVYSFAE